MRRASAVPAALSQPYLPGSTHAAGREPWGGDPKGGDPRGSQAAEAAGTFTALLGIKPKTFLPHPACCSQQDMEPAIQEQIAAPQTQRGTAHGSRRAGLFGHPNPSPQQWESGTTRAQLQPKRFLQLLAPERSQQPAQPCLLQRYLLALVSSAPSSALCF